MDSYFRFMLEAPVFPLSPPLRTLMLRLIPALLLLLPASALAQGGDSLLSWGYEVDQVADSPAGNDFVQAVAGSDHSLALRTDGSIVSWGDDTDGQVSDTPAGTGFMQVAAGQRHSRTLR